MLRSLAVLSGHLHPVVLDAYDRPDVVQFDRAGQRLFLADATDTESSRCHATRARLRSYRSAAVAWHSSGVAVRLLLCHRDVDPDGWVDLLEDLAGDNASAASTTLGDDRLTRVDLGGDARRSRTPPLGFQAWQPTGPPD